MSLHATSGAARFDLRVVFDYHPSVSSSQPSANSTREARVKEYYDHNSRRFLRFGQGGEQAAIHRAVWGPGVVDRAAAFQYVNELVLQRLRDVGSNADDDGPVVVDMGCGVGASLLYLAERTPLSGLGVTLSPVQAAMASARFADSVHQGRLRCAQGSFLQLPVDPGTVDVAFSIEAFIHAADDREFFDEAARVLKPGGRLLLCDDFLVERDPARATARRARLLDEFVARWHANSLCCPTELAALTPHLKLVEDIDLTPYLELGRPRDHLIRAMLALGRHLPIRSPYWDSLRGGDALQQCLKRQIVSYRFLVFERS